jgi:hypothetical protein
VPYFASAIAAESTAAGRVAPSGPFPGIASFPANIAGVAPFGADPWPLTTMTRLSRAE